MKSLSRSFAIVGCWLITEFQSYGYSKEPESIPSDIVKQVQKVNLCQFEIIFEASTEIPFDNWLKSLGCRRLRPAKDVQKKLKDYAYVAHIDGKTITKAPKEVDNHLLAIPLSLWLKFDTYEVVGYVDTTAKRLLLISKGFVEVPSGLLSFLNEKPDRIPRMIAESSYPLQQFLLDYFASRLSELQKIEIMKILPSSKLIYQITRVTQHLMENEVIALGTMHVLADAIEKKILSPHEVLIIDPRIWTFQLNQYWLNLAHLHQKKIEAHVANPQQIFKFIKTLKADGQYLSTIAKSSLSGLYDSKDGPTYFALELQWLLHRGYHFSLHKKSNGYEYIEIVR